MTLAVPERPNPPIRLVALDIDGTLIGEDLVLRPRVQATIRAVTERGIGVILATGRIATSAAPYARRLGLTLPLIAMQGAVVRELPADETRLRGRLLDHRALPADVVADAIDWARANGLVPHCNHLEELIAQDDDPWLRDYERYEFGLVKVVPDLHHWLPRRITKVIAVADGHRPERLLEAARAAFAGRADVTVSHPLFMEWTAPGVNKGAALRRLARRLGIPLAAVLAVGDQRNDIEMIAAAGWGVAMPTAPAVVRAAARLVAPPLDEDGLATVLEDLVLRA